MASLAKLGFALASMVSAEPASYLRGSVNISEEIAVNTSRTVQMSIQSLSDSCIDTVEWTNGYNCRRDGKGSRDGCVGSGWTCDGYVRQGWCVDGAPQPHWKTHVYAFGAKLNYPEENCCACGKAGSAYIAYWDKNAYEPYGAVDIDSGDVPQGLSSQQCQDICTEDAECDCVTFARGSGKCYKRKQCDPSGWTSWHNRGYNVYVKRSQATTTLTPPQRPLYANVGNGRCVGRSEAIGSALECVAAAEELWPGEDCQGRAWKDIVEPIAQPENPQGCFLVKSARGTCSLRFNFKGNGNWCPVDQCQVACKVA